MGTLTVRPKGFFILTVRVCNVPVPTRADEVPALAFGNSPLRHMSFVVPGAVWAALTAHEYVDDAFGLPAFLLPLVVGVLFGIAVFAWVTRTRYGERARRLYRDAPLG